MKTFHASFYETWQFGNFAEIDCIVIANTESEALGLVLDKYPETTRRNWKLYEIDPNILAVHEINRRGT